jgi:hypothetical protein
MSSYRHCHGRRRRRRRRLDGPGGILHSFRSFCLVWSNVSPHSFEQKTAQ